MLNDYYALPDQATVEAARAADSNFQSSLSRDSSMCSRAATREIMEVEVAVTMPPQDPAIMPLARDMDLLLRVNNSKEFRFLYSQ